MGSLNANRTTKDWKINLNTGFDIYNKIYDFGDSTVKSRQNSENIYGLIVKSISNHWSVGGTFKVLSSSYNNQKILFNIMPVLSMIYSRIRSQPEDN